MDQEEIKVGHVCTLTINNENYTNTIDVDIIHNNGKYQLAILIQGSFDNIGTDVAVFYSTYISKILYSNRIKITSIEHIVDISYNKISVVYYIDKDDSNVYLCLNFKNFMTSLKRNNDYLRDTKQIGFIIESESKINKIIAESKRKEDL